MEVLNLLPDDVIEARRRRRLWGARGVTAGAALALSLAALGATALARSGAARELSRELTRREEARSHTQELARLESWIESAGRRSRLAEALIGGPSAAGLVAEVVVAVPRGVTLSLVQLDRGKAASWEVRGSAPTPSEVAAFLGRLAASPSLRDADLELTERAQTAGVSMQRFQVTGAFPPEGAAP
ncbi:MAG: PilN domain-containing protein [Planctomycetes bacterium]|nr:PilN domain-containing protein [Planctomycetota bacterium]